MSFGGRDFQQTSLWRNVFDSEPSDPENEEKQFFRQQYLTMRDRAKALLSKISLDLPEMTVHDISHADALWDMASLVADNTVTLNPAEGFVLGASFLLHDAAMSLAAYPGGLKDVKKTLEWKDAVVRFAKASKESAGTPINTKNPPNPVIRQVLPEVLRRLHARQAESLAVQEWIVPNHEPQYLIENSDLRGSYGTIIGRIAHSHWWTVHKVEHEMPEKLGGPPNLTSHEIDPLAVACLLRVADALHLDSRRAPSFMRAITKPRGHSALHWDFQGLIQRPFITDHAVVFTTGRPFDRSKAEAWWLACDKINEADQELRDVDMLFQTTGHSLLKARMVKGAGSPETLSQTVETKGWRPVDTRLQVSDVPRIVETLGGSKLYGDDPSVALRELIQNAADAVEARKTLEGRPAHWGQIVVSMIERDGAFWLAVEDNGIGMSEQVLTGPLLDFGSSFWRSAMAMEEFPGLMASGMDTIGRFGIGFFAVFMLGRVVRVYSRRFDRGKDTGLLLEFLSGTGTRPILSPENNSLVPIDGGTRVEVRWEGDRSDANELLASLGQGDRAFTLSECVGRVAPNLDVPIYVDEDDQLLPVSRPGDWLKLTPAQLVRRLDPDSVEDEKRGLDPKRWKIKVCKAAEELMRPIADTDGNIFGRAFIWPSSYSYHLNSGLVTITGLRARTLNNIQGILCGKAVNAARDAAQPLVAKAPLARWASEQAELICDSILVEKHQAQAAEIVLACGGSIGGLKIINLGSEWLNIEEFELELLVRSELAIAFDGEFEYDEDMDEVHPKEFRELFEQDEDVAVVCQFNATVLNVGQSIWPSSLTGIHSRHGSRVAAVVEQKIVDIWGPYSYGMQEEKEVGRVDDVAILRKVDIYYDEEWNEE